MSHRWLAVGTLGAVLAVIIVTVVTRLPLSAPPAPRSDQLDALRSIPSAVVDRGRDFHDELRPGMYGSLILGLVVASILGLTPWGSKIIELVGRPWGGHWLATALGGGLTIVFLGEIVTFPLVMWQHSIVRRYGLSTQSWAAWGVDVLKGYALSAVLAVIVLSGFFAIIRAAPRWWWMIVAGCAAGLVILLSFIYPLVIEPVFNRFTPMEEGHLRTRLIAMAHHDGVPVSDVLIADASRRTRAVNAYVSGFGPTRRIVVYDTLVATASTAEVESVVAHELGHAKEGDVATGTVLGALSAAAGVLVVYLLGGWGALLRRADVESVAEPRAIALLLALLTIGGMVFTPIEMMISRRMENRADMHALMLTNDPATFELMQTRLSSSNLGDPDPPWLEHLLWASHPSTVERIAVARAWARGNP